MFYEWVSDGAAFGIKAFVALVVFALLCAAIYGLIVVGGYVVGGERDRGEDRGESRRF